MGLIVLSKKKAAERANVSLRHFERLIANGEGPPLVRLGPRRVGIIEEDSDAWLRSRRSVPPGFKSLPDTADKDTTKPEGQPLAKRAVPIRPKKAAPTVPTSEVGGL